MSVALWRGALVGSSDGGHRTIYPGPTEMRRTVWYVNGSSTNSSDAATHGRRLAPLQTIAYAVGTAASAGDVVVISASHRDPGVGAAATYDEALGLTVALARLSIFGTGSGATRCRLIPSGAPCFTVTADGVEIRNLIFEDVADDGINGWPIDLQGDGCVVGQCAFEQNSSSRIIALAGVGHLIEDCELEVTGTAPSTTYSYGILIADGAHRPHIENCTFDGGAVGWRYGAVYLAGATTCTGLVSVGCTLNNDASMVFAGTLRGFIARCEMGAGCRIEDATRLRHYEAGLVAAAGGGDDSVLGAGFWTSGDVWWVNNTHSLANDANTGTSPEAPLNTLAQGMANLGQGNGDLIIVASGHNETLTGVVGSNIYAVTEDDTKIFGLGDGSSRPRLTVAAATSGSGDTVLFNVSAAGFCLDGIRVAASTYTNGNVTAVYGTGQWCEVYGCSFTHGAYDLYAVRLGTGCAPHRVSSCTFEVSALGATAAILLDGSAVNRYSQIVDCSFDQGSSVLRWGVAAVSVTGTNPTNLLTNTLLNGADMILQASTTVVAGTIKDATSRVQWSNT